ncbi:MAG TPA: ABC transporter permease [Candidatus Bathyarchaeia archaeon]|nr:ABC transporter permease [Candidatus Bathyarchaeia archaeon]
MPPSDLRQLFVVSKYELLKYLRGKRLLIIIALIAIIGALNLVVPPTIGSGYDPDPVAFSSGMLNEIGILVVLCATFFGADAIVSEFEQKTGLVLFSNAVKRHVVLLGKFVASAVVSVGAVALYYAITVIAVVVIDGSVAANTSLSFLYALAYLFGILAIAYLFSVVLKSSVYSIVLTFFTFFLILPIVDRVGSTIAHFKPWFSITFASGIILNIFQQPYPTDVVRTVQRTFGSTTRTLTVAQYYPSVGQGLAVIFVYFVVGLVLALLIMRTREM